MVTYAKTSHKMVNPRDIAGNAEEEEFLDSPVLLSVTVVSDGYVPAVS